MKKPNYLFLQIVVLCLAVLFRLIHLGGSFWLDEAAQALESLRPLSQQLNISHDFQPPLFHLLVHGLIQINQSEAWLRLAALIPGLITIWLTIKIGTRLFSRRSGLLAGFLLATSQFHLFYSQELRPYSLAACLALIAFWGWLDMVQSSKKISYLFFFASLAGLYTMYLFPVFLLALLLLTFIFYRSHLKLVVFYFALLVIGFLPWIPSFLEQLQIGTSLASTSSTWSSIVSPPLLKMLPLVYLKFIFGRIPYDPNLVMAVFTIFLAIALFVIMLRLLKHKNGRLVVGLVLIPALISQLISIFVPVLDPKRILFSLPFLSLLIGSEIKKSRLSRIILAVAFTLNLSAIGRYATDPDVQREPWRQAVSVYESQAPSDAQVIFAFDAPFAPWVWYQKQNLATLSITSPDQIPPLSSSQVALLDYLRPLYDADDQIEKNLNLQGYRQTGYYQYPGIGKINLYAR